MTVTASTSERLWTAARGRHGNFRGRRRPSPGLAKTLTMLHDLGHAYGRQLARESGLSQGTLTGQWLPQLERLGFVERAGTVAGLGYQGGGMPAQYWRLTSAGRKLVAALLDEARIASAVV
jgi:DNA-binding HxlR family transcriptional regulator